MEKSKTIELYEILIKGFPLTKENLTIYNFKEEDIEELLKENIIKEIEPNKWMITNVNGFYRYGIYLELNNQLFKAENCYRICYKLAPTNREICMQLLLFELKRKNFIAVQKMFSLLEQIEPEKYKEDNNLILYLLGITLYNNKEYQIRTKNMTYEDVLISSNKDVEQNPISNKIRCTLLNQKYPYALNLINDLNRKELIYNVKYELFKELTISVINLTRKFKYKIKNAARNKDYVTILQLLDIKSRNQNLGHMEINIQSVANAILEVINTNKIPKVHFNDTIYLSDAIQDNNFQLAKTLNTSFLAKTKQNPDDDILNILLNDIISRIENIKMQETKNKLNEDKESIQTTKYNNFQKVLSADEELAYYIKEMNFPLKETIKKMGILPEQIVVIKLIYARDYFYEGNYEEGNKLLKEVEETNLNSNKIVELLNEIKEKLSKEKTETIILSKK